VSKLKYFKSIYNDAYGIIAKGFLSMALLFHSHECHPYPKAKLDAGSKVYQYSSACQYELLCIYASTALTTKKKAKSVFLCPNGSFNIFLNVFYIFISFFLSKNNYLFKFKYLKFTQIYLNLIK